MEELRWLKDAFRRRNGRCGRFSSTPSAPSGSTGRPMRSSTSARTRSGSWSMTNSAGRRCLASMKNRLPASPKGLAETGAIAPDHFRRAVEAVRRFRAIADAMGVSRIDAVATEAMRRASNGPKLARAIEAESGLKVRILSGGEEARFATLGVISGFFRPVGAVGDMGGGSLEVAEAIDDHVGDLWASLPLGALPVEAMMSAGFSAAKRQIDEILRRSLPRALAKPVFYAVGGGWRALAKAHMEAVGAPVKVVHGYTLAAVEAREFARAVSRLTAAKLAATPGVTERRARTLPAAALTLDRVLKYLNARPRRLFRSRLARGVSLLAAQPGGTISRSPGRGRATDRAAARARARFRARTRVLDRKPFFR